MRLFTRVAIVCLPFVSISRLLRGADPEKIRNGCPGHLPGIEILFIFLRVP